MLLLRTLRLIFRTDQISKIINRAEFINITLIKGVRYRAILPVRLQDDHKGPVTFVNTGEHVLILPVKFRFLPTNNIYLAYILKKVGTLFKVLEIMLVNWALMLVYFAS